MIRINESLGWGKVASWLLVKARNLLSRGIARRMVLLYYLCRKGRDDNKKCGRIIQVTMGDGVQRKESHGGKRSMVMN